MRVYSNVAQATTLSAGVSDTDDTLPTNSSDLAADGWPVPGTGESASARIVDGSDVEVVTYTGIDGGTLTGVVRDADGDTAAQSWPSGATVEHVASAGGLDRRVPDPSSEPDDRWLRTQGGALVYTDPPEGGNGGGNGWTLIDEVTDASTLSEIVFDSASIATYDELRLTAQDFEQDDSSPSITQMHLAFNDDDESGNYLWNGFGARRDGESRSFGGPLDGVDDVLAWAGIPNGYASEPRQWAQARIFRGDVMQRTFVTGESYTADRNPRSEMVRYQGWWRVDTQVAKIAVFSGLSWTRGHLRLEGR